MTDLRGAKFVSGRVEDGRVVLTRSDGSESTVPNVLVVGGIAVTDNGDGTVTIDEVT